MERAVLHARRALLCGTVTAFALFVVGCLSIEQMAPPVGPVLSSVATANGLSVALVEKGREVYLVDCSRCHGIEPIGRYTAERWPGIIERMAPKSKLDESRVDALRAYVLSAHAVLAGHAATTKLARTTGVPGAIPDKMKRRTQ